MGDQAARANQGDTYSGLLRDVQQFDNSKELAHVFQDQISEESVVRFMNHFEKIAEKKDFSLIHDMVASCVYKGGAPGVLVREQGRLQIIHEHLSRFPKSQ